MTSTRRPGLADLPDAPTPGAFLPPPGAAAASPPVQLAAFLMAVLAMALGATHVGGAGWFVAGAVVLALGIAVGLTVDLSRVFRSLAGWFLGLVAGVITLVVSALLRQRAGIDIPPLTAGLVVVGVTGLDWSIVSRLRAAVVISGVLVLPLVGAKEAWAYPAAIAWFVGAVVTLWLLERDAHRALPPLEPLGPTASPDDDRLRPGDLARIAGVALAAGIALAFLLGNPSCSVNTPKAKGPGGQFGPQGGRTGGSADGVPGLTAPKSGPAKGGTFKEDANGKVYLQGRDGQRYTLSEEDGHLIVRDRNGNAVGEATLSQDHLYATDPKGNVLVPGATGSSPSAQLPISDRWIRTGNPPPQTSGTSVTDDQGRTVVSGVDGVTRTYDTDPQGRPRVRVDDPPAPSRTFDVDSSGPTKLVHEYDADGKLVNTYLYDPAGRVTAPRSGAGDEATVGQPPPSPARHDVPWLLLGLLAVALAAIATVAWVLTHRPPPEPERSWAERLADRLDHEGRAHGRGRGRHETVTGYARVLADDALPDPRVASVGVVVSQALFARSEPPAGSRAWAEQVIDSVSADNPAPRWTDRFRRVRGTRRPGRSSTGR